MRILIGWVFNYLGFAVLLTVYVVYGCTFESLSSEDSSEAFMISWLWSVVQRFLAMEPIIILVGALLPMLFASQFCANMCTESFNSALGVAFAVCIQFTKRLKKF